MLVKLLAQGHVCTLHSAATAYQPAKAGVTDHMGAIESKYES